MDQNLETNGSACSASIEQNAPGVPLDPFEPFMDLMRTSRAITRTDLGLLSSCVVLVHSGYFTGGWGGERDCWMIVLGSKSAR